MRHKSRRTRDGKVVMIKSAHFHHVGDLEAEDANVQHQQVHGITKVGIAQDLYFPWLRHALRFHT